MLLIDGGGVQALPSVQLTVIVRERGATTPTNAAAAVPLSHPTAVGGCKCPVHCWALLVGRMSLQQHTAAAATPIQSPNCSSMAPYRANSNTSQVRKLQGRTAHSEAYADSLT
jgi:hypothetical protein